MSNSNETANPSGATKIQYQWSYDAAYYSVVVDRFYKQKPFVLHLPIQFTLLWLCITVVLLVQYGSLTLEFCGWVLLAGVLGIPGLVILTKQGIMLKFRLRSSFRTKVDFSLSEDGITIHQKSLNGTYPWATYARAVRFSDGMLLLKPGAIRWLPDNALKSGTVDEAIAIVRSKLPTRLLT